jgi:hypothetical protein
MPNEMLVTTGNDICERVIRYWEKNHQILPELMDASVGTLEEVYDGIPDEYKDLREDLLMLVS